jgi:acyl-CoA synthetase (AMP-forming)/AMP-acid ligase II
VDLDPRSLIKGSLKLAERGLDEAYFAGLLARSGVVGLEMPHTLAQMGMALERYGMLGSLPAMGAIRYGDRTAIIDERGELTYQQLHENSNAIANAWRDKGLQPGDGVAVLVRNHRAFLESVFAGAKCGARIILLNTSFAGPQIREVAEREGTDLLVYDDEYSEVLEGIDDPPHGRYRAWVEDDKDADDTLDALIASGDKGAPPRAGEGPKITILTSGTTGTPKGAPRSEPKSLGLIGGLLSKVPFKAGEITELCVPMFHALGFAQALVGVGLGSTLVIRRRFDPEATLKSLEEHHATAMVMVPVMLQRTLELGEEKINEYDHSSLRIIFLSGSALPADVTKRALKAFGPVVYNLYGSTEISYATIATPEDLQDDPATVGKVVRGSVVKIYDDDEKEVPQGESGRIFVGNLSQFEGYTGGEDTKDEIEGLIASGDVGHFDEQGRLYIDGRDDEMIVSGGENVFPAEVEELLASHEQIEEAAAVGVEDEKFGQRLKAFVVQRGDGLSEDDVKKYVKENLANYKVPREVVFVDELPRNATGKVLKRELLEQEEESDDGGGGGESSQKDGAEGKSSQEDGAKSKKSSSDGAEAKKSDSAEAKKSDDAEAKKSDDAEAKKSDGAKAKKSDGAEATSDEQQEEKAAT